MARGEQGCLISVVSNKDSDKRPLGPFGPFGCSKDAWFDSGTCDDNCRSGVMMVRNFVWE